MQQTNTPVCTQYRNETEKELYELIWDNAKTKELIAFDKTPSNLKGILKAGVFSVAGIDVKIVIDKEKNVIFRHHDKNKFKGHTLTHRMTEDETEKLLQQLKTTLIK